MMQLKAPSRKGKWLVFWIIAAIFTIWYSVALNRSLNGLDEYSQAEYRNYEAYFKLHNCDRRIQTDRDDYTMKPYLYCDNGVWSEKSLVDVANQRVPRGT